MLGEHLLLAFDGLDAPSAFLHKLEKDAVAGVTLFRGRNVASAEQVRALTDTVHSRAAVPLLVAADQEGGQFLALGDDTTPFPGNMALGATGDPALAQEVGRAIGVELRALGVTVNYAPVADLATNPANTALGIRSFGDDPEQVAAFVTSFVRGMQSAGVAATLKHFPGKGDAGVDSHFALPVLAHTAERFASTELVPFRAGIAAGARLVMSAHVAAPALTRSPELPATLARPVMHDLLRRELRFRGIAVSDALDMRALAQGAGAAIEAVAGLRAGLDLLLLPADEELQAIVGGGLEQAARRDLLPAAARARSVARVQAVRTWLAGFEQPSLELVGCDAHRELAARVAARAVTLVRNRAGLLPLRLPSDARVAAVMPMPSDLTPADTSSYVRAGLGAALRGQHAAVDEVVTTPAPTAAEIADLVRRAKRYAAFVVGTIHARPGDQQAALVCALLGARVPVVTVALRTPWDLAAYPDADTHVCTYGLLPPQLDALAAALFGKAPFPGRLPVRAPT